MTSTDHAHPNGTPPQRQFSSPSELCLPDLPRRADDAVLDQLFYATRDRCFDPECRPMLLDRIANDAVATHKLLDWSCWIASEVYGGLPAELVDEDAAADTLFRPSATFIRIAAKYHKHREEGSTVYNACSVAQRREAADNAVTLVAGLEVWWTDFLYQ
ncbi:hypothetical protein [Streptomyces sp. NPDC019224]|uniref:hypothetical protein n=1 Tax=Streptomyces sp. NPDC019224 TaxID=3154484 RepID=UPI0033F24D78